jgi:hypothetical protein
MEIADLTALALQAAQAGDTELAEALCWVLGKSLHEARSKAPSVRWSMHRWQKKRPPRP